MWLITRDLLAETSTADAAESRVGTTGTLRSGDGGNGRVKFRLFDDDGELYYEGTLDDDDECVNQSDALNWGAADAGAAHIKVLRGNEWVEEIG